MNLAREQNEGDDGGASARSVRIVYNDDIVRKFALVTVLWGVVGMLVGVLIATQLAVPQLNLTSWLTYGRLRPLHTNAVIFAFVGNMVFAGIYYSTQRLLKTRMASDTLSSIHFWGWQLIIVAAAITLPLGITQGKEYAELEWPIDIAIAGVWVVFAINFFWTLAKRNEKHMYVAIWFYIASIVTVAVLHIVNSLAIPVGPLKSYSIFGGAQDALVQWWYGHNAVAFFLTTPVLGIMYYFLPKAAGRPVYSYRLSIIHFWALIFVYIWAGPHHLLNTALPDWAQSLGMVFSVMLVAPSWGGMINGLLTLRGAWDKVRTEPVLKFFAAGVTFYGMATFEGPLLSIKSVSALAHYTDWIVGHVHSGALGWNGFMAAGMLYWLVPKLYGTKLYSKKMADQHFYIGTIGILIYMVSMWIAGIQQGLMWRAVNPDGSLANDKFVDTVAAIRPMYYMRIIGGLMYFVGIVMMAINIVATVRQGKAVNGEADVVVEPENPAHAVSWKALVFSRPVALVTTVAVLLAGVGVLSEVASVTLAVTAVFVAVAGAMFVQRQLEKHGSWHRVLEGRALVFTAFTVIAVLIGGIAEIVPSLVVKKMDEAAMKSVKPYRALELAGRDIYIREGCYTCHSQMIRPFQWETKRYGGEASTLEDSAYDHPFQWGSKRTGPDLAHEAMRGLDANWQYRHFLDPREINAASNMPSYAFLKDGRVDMSTFADRMRAMKAVGVPYTQAQIDNAANDAKAEADEISASLAKAGATVAPDAEIIALISYVQRLGRKAQ